MIAAQAYALKPALNPDAQALLPASLLPSRFEPGPACAEQCSKGTFSPPDSESLASHPGHPLTFKALTLELRRQQQIELCELAVDAVKALGFYAGVLHVELKYTSRTGPQLIEVGS